EFSAGNLAEMRGVSVWNLSRIVKKEYGKRYAEIVHEYRIKDAMIYLRDKRFETYSVYDIGAMVGFGNRQSFFWAFKKVAGMTPEKYRRMGR
ncbi:MAG: AraC family transcriptional regulator, partial [Prevotella sp.]|nr:AraC family transcriptional regulator [Prevotella sp.]